MKTNDNPLEDAVSLINNALQLDTVSLNYPGAYEGFNLVVETLRRHGLYRHPGEAPPQRTTESKRKKRA